MNAITKLIKDLMSVAEAYKEGKNSGIGTITDIGMLLDNFNKEMEVLKKHFGDLPDVSMRDVYGELREMGLSSDKNENKVTKESDFNFENISITDMKKAFTECTPLSTMPKVDFTYFKEEDIKKMWKNCNNNDS